MGKCPADCGMQLLPEDLLTHLDDRCPGQREPGLHAKWITRSDASRMGVSSNTLHCWARVGLVRCRGSNMDREYLLRDFVTQVALRRDRSGRRKSSRHAIEGPVLVYFIQAVGGGPIKIGMSNDPKERLATLQAGSPVMLRIIGIADGGQDKEMALHRRLAAHRLHGEWFADVPAVHAVRREVARRRR